MKPEQQRIAIAEACGWKLVEDNPDYEPYWEDPKGNMIAKVGFQNRLPDYLNDLNAMHEAEKVLTQDQMIDYSRHVGKFVTSHLPASRAAWMDYRLLNSTATQRAEAFLRTINKWEETK